MSIRKVGIVGSESLLGREIREVLRTSPIPFDVTLIGADEEDAGRITQDGEEAAVITTLDQTNLVMADVVVLAGSPASTRKAWGMLSAGPAAPLIDATRQLDEIPAARVHAPLAGTNSEEGRTPAIIAHPAAVVLAQILTRLHKAVPVVRAVVQVFEPASERGQAGIDELHQQTMNLFSFQQLPKDIFDEQLAYNLLASLGSESLVKLAATEAQIERHLASLCGADGVPLPSLRLIQAPVFHGYSFSLWVELAREVAEAEIGAALEGGDVDVRGAGEPAPNNVGMASQDGFAVGDIRRDHNQTRAYWLWAAADNLRTTAVNTARLIEQWASE